MERTGGGPWEGSVRRTCGAAAVALLLLVCAGSAGAQEIPAPTVAVTGGVMDRDFRGEGASPIVGFRVRLPLGEHFLIEPGLTGGRFDDGEIAEGERADPRIPLAVLDFQVQYQLPLDRFRPWIGLGAGGAADFRDERGLDEFIVSTFSASGGLAVDLSGSAVALGEVRARTLDDFDSSAVALSLGLGWRL